MNVPTFFMIFDFIYKYIQYIYELILAVLLIITIVKINKVLKKKFDV